MNGASVIGGGSLGNPGAELASDRHRRFQRRRPVRHPVAERQRPGRDLGDERDQRRSAAAVSAIRGRAGTRIGTGDYNGDGHSDILFQNSSGEVAVWEVSGNTVIGGGSIGSPGPTWHI